MYEQPRSGCAWLECPYCIAHVNDEMGQVFQRAMCLKEARTAPADCSGSCTGKLERREEPFVSHQTLEHPPDDLLFSHTLSHDQLGWDTECIVNCLMMEK